MKIKLIRKIKQRIRDISNVWSVAGIRNVYVMAILPHFGSKSTRDIRRERKQQAILHYLQTNYQNLILKYTQKEEIPPAFNQAPIWVCWWQGENAMPRNHSIFRHDNFIGCFSADKIGIFSKCP